MSDPGAGLFAQVGRSPEPKRGGALLVSGDQIAAVRTKRGGGDVAGTGEL